MFKLSKRFIPLAAVVLSLAISMPTKAAENIEDYNSTLLKKGYSQSEISSMSEQVKEKIASKPGEKADYSVTVSEYYVKDGVRTKVTPENKTKLRQQMKQDILDYSKEEQISVMELAQPIEFSTASTPTGATARSGGGNLTKGDLTFSAYIEKFGTSSLEYHYSTFLDFMWETSPIVLKTDSIALAWDNKFTGDATSLTKWYNSGSNYKDVKSTMSTTQSLYGYSAKFPLFVQSVIGGLSQEISALKSNAGKGKFQAKYIHTIGPNIGSVSFGPASINIPISWVAQEFVLDFNIGIGN